MYCDKNKQILNEIDHAYRCRRLLNITDKLIPKTKDHVYITILLWIELNLRVKPSVHLY